MRPNSLSFRALFTCILVLAVAAVCWSPAANAQTNKKKPAPAKKAAPKTAAPAADPPGTTIIMGNLRAWYKKFANAEGVWGKDEVARAFNYRHAYDWVPAGQEPKEDSTASITSDPDAAKSTSTGSSREAKRNYWRKDKIFMDALDLDGDDVINKEEFEAWAHDYAVEKAKQYQAMKQAIALQQQAMMLQMKAMQASLQRYQNQNRGRYNRAPNRRRR